MTSDLLLTHTASALTLAGCVLAVAYGGALFLDRLSRVPTTEAVEQRAASLVRISRAELRR